MYECEVCVSIGCACVHACPCACTCAYACGYACAYACACAREHHNSRTLITSLSSFGVPSLEDSLPIGNVFHNRNGNVFPLWKRQRELPDSGKENKTWLAKRESCCCFLRWTIYTQYKRNACFYVHTKVGTHSINHRTSCYVDVEVEDDGGANDEEEEEGAVCGLKIQTEAMWLLGGITSKMTPWGYPKNKVGPKGFTMSVLLTLRLTPPFSVSLPIPSAAVTTLPLMYEGWWWWLCTTGTLLPPNLLQISGHYKVFLSARVKCTWLVA